MPLNMRRLCYLFLNASLLLCFLCVNFGKAVLASGEYIQGKMAAESRSG